MRVPVGDVAMWGSLGEKFEGSILTDTDKITGLDLQVMLPN
jgi:hypothetical protein